MVRPPPTMLVLVPMVLLTLHRSHTLSRYSALTRSFAIVSSRASTSWLQPRDSQYKHQSSHATHLMLQQIL